MQSKLPSEAGSAGAVSLRMLVPFLALFGAGLYEVVGLPHAANPPIGVPDLSSLEAILRSSRPPLDGAVYVVGLLGWLVWAWLVLSLLLQVGVAVAERVADGTEVVRQARWIADLLSAPLVRKAVRTSLAGGLVARMALAGVPAAAAAPTESAGIIVNFSPRGGATTSTEHQFWATWPGDEDELVVLAWELNGRPIEGVPTEMKRGQYLASASSRAACATMTAASGGRHRVRGQD